MVYKVRPCLRKTKANKEPIEQVRQSTQFRMLTYGDSARDKDLGEGGTPTLAGATENEGR